MTLITESRILDTEEYSVFALSDIDYQIIRSCDNLTDSSINFVSFKMASYYEFATQNCLMSILSTNQSAEISFRPVYEKAFQIINVSGHWIMSFFDQGVVYVVDTFYRTPNDFLQRSLWCLYGHNYKHEMEVEYLAVSKHVSFFIV